MHLSPEDLARFLKLLAKLGFVGSSGNDYQFPHEKIREFCYEELSSAVRIAVHRDVLRTLESFWPDRLDELAFHGERAGRCGATERLLFGPIVMRLKPTRGRLRTGLRLGQRKTGFDLNCSRSEPQHGS